MTGVRDGLGFEEVNQEVTNTKIISGTNVYAKTAVTAPTITTTTVNAGGTVTGEDIVANDTVSDSDGQLFSIGIGSGTTTFGARIIAGSTALGAGSNVWEEFSTAFNSTPIITLGNMTQTDGIMFPAGSISAGSFYAEGVNASDEFSFIAIGL